MKKHIYIYCMLAVAIFATSCDEYLEEQVISDVSANEYYNDEQGFEDGVKAVYSFLKFITANERGMTLHNFGTDAFTNGADGSHKGINVYDSRLNQFDEGYFREQWNELYRAINQANAMIDRSAGIDIPADVLNERLAEVRFLRAFYYFELVRMYGDVHLTLEETIGVQTEATRTPAAEIYSQAIIPDLEFAISVLPEEQGEYGRATKPAAEFLLSKVFLTRGQTEFAQPGDVSQAQSLMEGVINNYGFALLENWGDVFDQDNQRNSEVIWAMQNTEDPILNGNQGNRAHLYYLMEYDKLPGMTRDVANGRPWKRFKPTDWLLGLWDRDIDLRYEVGFKHVWFTNNPGTYNINGRDVELALGDTAVYLPGFEVTDEFRASKPYSIFTPSEYTERVYATLNKFIDPRRPDRQHTQGSRDWMFMRLADSYLIVAEAAFLQGDLQTAADALNMVRVRAAREGSEDAMLITAADVDLDFILDERARELAGERHRWFDLVRTGKLVERVRLHNEQGGPNIQDFHVLRPIPQDQIDKTTSDFPQNPGY